MVRNGHALPLNELTPRERNVLEGIACGLDNKEIAATLKMSEKTVRNISLIFLQKFGWTIGIKPLCEPERLGTGSYICANYARHG